MDYGFTSHLLTIPVIIEGQNMPRAEIISDLGFKDKGVYQADYIGYPVGLSTTQSDDDILSVILNPTGSTEVIGIIATKPRPDSNKGKWKCDIKCFGIFMEAWSTTAPTIGATAYFSGAQAPGKYQTPYISTPSAGSRMKVAKVRNPENNVFISTLYIPWVDVLNTSTRPVTAKEETELEKIALKEAEKVENGD